MRKKVKTYGEVIARLLEETGLSAYRLSKRAGLDHATLSNIANDKRKPAAETLEKLLRAAGKNWGWLDSNLVAVEVPGEE